MRKELDVDLILCGLGMNVDNNLMWIELDMDRIRCGFEFDRD